MTLSSFVDKIICSRETAAIFTARISESNHHFLSIQEPLRFTRGLTEPRFWHLSKGEGNPISLSEVAMVRLGADYREWRRAKPYRHSVRMKLSSTATVILWFALQAALPEDFDKGLADIRKDEAGMIRESDLLKVWIRYLAVEISMRNIPCSQNSFIRFLNCQYYFEIFPEHILTRCGNNLPISEISTQQRKMNNENLIGNYFCIIYYIWRLGLLSNVDCHRFDQFRIYANGLIVAL
jgi:hypothetical protein